MTQKLFTRLEQHLTKEVSVPVYYIYSTVAWFVVFIAAFEMSSYLDSRRPSIAPLCWASFGLGIALCYSIMRRRVKNAEGQEHVAQLREDLAQHEMEDMMLHRIPDSPHEN